MSMIGIHEESDQDYKDLEKMKRLIALYERIIYGSDEVGGLLDHYDTYYVGCWDEDFETVEKLKRDLGVNNLDLVGYIKK